MYGEMAADGVERLKEKYTLLQSLCKQQILLNETLKSEVSRLEGLYRKVSRERSLLLSELLENHTSCGHLSQKDVLKLTCRSHSPAPDGIKRPMNRRRSPADQDFPKKSKLSDEKPRTSYTCDDYSTLESMAFSDRSSTADAHVQRTSADSANLVIKSGVMARSHTSRLQSQLTSSTNSVFEHNSARSMDARELQRDGSPPSITVSSSTISHTQQGHGKPINLLSSTSLGTSVPFVPFAGARNPSGGLHVKNSLSSTIQVNDHNTATRNSFERSTSVLRPPQVTSAVKLSHPSGGPRILIQPSSTNSRSVLIKATETLFGGVPEEQQ